MQPSRLWKNLTPEQRTIASDAFWRDEQGDVQIQHAEAVLAIARRLNFRAKSVQALPLERRARLLSQLPDVSDSVATRALIAYHFAAQRDLMGAFLDALGIAHERGLIQDETVPPPDVDKLSAAITAVRSQFAVRDVDLYLRTLAALDPDTWTHVDAALAKDAARA